MAAAYYEDLTSENLREIAGRVIEDAFHDIEKARKQVAYCDNIAISNRGNLRSSKEQHAILSLAMTTLSDLDEDIEFFAGQGPDPYFAVLDIGIDGPQAIRERHHAEATEASENLRCAIHTCIENNGLGVRRAGEFQNFGKVTR